MTAPAAPLLDRGSEQFKRAPGERPLEILETGCLGLLSFNAETREVRPFRCRGWGCPTCGPGKANLTAKAVREACGRHQLRYLTTLTLAGRGSREREDPAYSRRLVSMKWNALSTRLKKTRYDPAFSPYRAWRHEARQTLQDIQDVPPDLGALEGRSRAVVAAALELPPGDRTHPILGPYLAVVEWQRDGTAHIHLATDRPIPHAVVSEAWGRLEGGFVFTSRHRNAPRVRDAEDVGRELGKYLVKAAGSSTAPWDTWRCKEQGGYRKTPWRRYWSSREVGRTIRDAKAAPAVAVDRPLEDESGPGWQVVLRAPLLEGLEAIPFSLRNRGPCIPACEGHQLPEGVCHLYRDTLRAWGTCHHEVPGGRCECEPPLKATDPAAYYAGDGEPCPDGIPSGPRKGESPHVDVLEDLPLTVQVQDGRYYLREAEEYENLLALEAYFVARGWLAPPGDRGPPR